MRQKNIIFLFILLTSTISCEQKSEIKAPVFEETKTIDISEAIGGYNKHYLLSEENLLYGFNQLSSQLDLFNWEDGAFIRTIPLPDVPEAYEFSLSEVLPISKDSVLFIDFFGKILLSDSDSDFIKAFNLNDYLPEGYEFFFGNNSQNLIHKNGNLIFRIHQSAFSPKEQAYYDGKILAKLNLKTLDEATIFGEYPDSYKIKNGKFFFNNTKLGIDYALHSDTEILISFRNEDSIQSSSVDKNNWFDAKSSFLKSPTPLDVNQSINQIEWMVKEGYYHDIITDNYNEVIYRICVLSQDLTDLDGKRNSAATREFSIQKFDANFNLLGETLFNSILAEYSFLARILTNDGLYLGVLDTPEEDMVFRKVSFN
ncbi:DUF4221 family protein [Belliella aquatica]|uniref:DUF4221 domain-containing protein n=1 Tax=Belliella aquatica TaxID=1323734 RepID=A0ABQ1MPQ3_9BACT|nr:DUF4221 family protein [Belliella aquatica]MCH7405989.1 DUF4221 domain-containing protein [Belliella aquatica]GGC43615.1 hypothetical protein GCM10010993_22610 [Belliella aquatica]